MSRFTKEQRQKVVRAFEALQNIGALELWRSKAESALHWDTIIAGHLETLTGIQVTGHVVRHLRSDLRIGWREFVDSTPITLDFEPAQSTEQIRIHFTPEELRNFVDERVRQALNTREINTATVRGPLPTESVRVSIPGQRAKGDISLEHAAVL